MSLVLYDFGAIRIEVSYLQLKGNVWYFRRRIPEDVRKLYPGKRVQLFFSLKTSDPSEAAKKADRFARQQNALWKSYREGNVDSGPDVQQAALGMLAAYDLRPGEWELWRKADVEPDRFIRELEYLSDGEGEIIGDNLPPHARLAADLFYGNEKPVPFLSDALALFIRLKGEEEGSREHSARYRAVGRFLEEAGDLPVDQYTREQARAFIDGLLSEGVKTTTVRRYVTYVSPVFSLALREYELNKPNIFDNIIIPKLGEDAKKRPPFSADELRLLQTKCLEKDDDIRWLAALVSDTGMRLAEAAGLQSSDLVLDAPVPHVVVQPNAIRKLKTPSSGRLVPLVGASLWAARRLAANTKDNYLFPRYLSDGKLKATHASNALSKWFKSIGVNKTTHCLRHTMRDRLRNVGASEEIGDRIGGWATKGVGQSYGQGHSLDVLQGWMLKLVDRHLWPEG